jgi:hypothetical protein
VKPERFYTEARLLSTTRADGHQASALDNGNTYQYVTGVGWVQLVPASGIEGQSLVVGSTELTAPDVPGPIRHRSRVEFGSHNKFVPEDGTEGEVATIDEDGETVLAPPVAPTFVPGGVTYPVDFSSGGVVSAVDRLIPAGALGPNGVLRYTAIIRMVNTVGARTVTWTPTAGALSNALTTTSLSSSANNWGIEYEYLMVNTDDEAVQVVTSTLSWSLYVSSSSTSSSDARIQQTGHAPTPVDTSVDWQLSAQIQASGVIDTSALVYGVAVEYGYSA